ncbi:monooxygenase family protein [Methylocella silvestris]|uniref:DUF4188 domain-containing protein n=1 Tax=Methylocella silvestris TaxID=199596 RepID=A0A2J7TM74_METSI|nr:DUF4188 domain-containing protein [Methylocella silvestris]PNG27863.1 hypothetical protein CR492_02945 [Methylocella silvestris]
MMKREVPDFSAYADLVIMMLGMRVRTLRGVKTLLGLGPPIEAAGAARPDGLLHADNAIIYGFYPLHLGMRWYWRDIDALEAWAKSGPHRLWWSQFMTDSGGTEFWHETYHMRGGMEAIYLDMTKPIGLANFMPVGAARGTMASRHKEWASPGPGEAPTDRR